jgi:hypothetical protein
VLLLLLLAAAAGVLAVDLAVFVDDITVIACTDHSYTGNITCCFQAAAVVHEHKRLRV